MFKRLDNRVHNFVSSYVPWTNVYGLARTILALATAITLIVNDVRFFFRPSSGNLDYPNCNSNISLFCLVPNDYIYLNILKWFCIIFLLIVASGWRPRITGIFHWWISYSIQVSALTLDGGEQVTAVFTLLLVPVTLTDPRKWHWEKYDRDKYIENRYLLHLGIIALCSFFIIRLQTAILYFHSTVAKLSVEEWVNGTAVFYYVQDPMLGLNPILLDLLGPFIESPLVVIPTWGTLVLQTCLVAFLFAPKKYWKYMLIAALLFHELIALLLGLVSFSIAMLAILILYLHPIEREFKFYFLQKMINKMKVVKEVSAKEHIFLKPFRVERSNFKRR